MKARDGTAFAQNLFAKVLLTFHSKDHDLLLLPARIDEASVDAVGGIRDTQHKRCHQHTSYPKGPSKWGSPQNEQGDLTRKPNMETHGKAI